MGFQVAALLLMAAFYGCYFGKMLRQKKQGVRTDQIGRGKTGAAKRVEITMKIATLLVELAGIAHSVCAFPTVVRIFGAACAALGVAAFVASVRTMGDSWRAGVSPEEKTIRHRRRVPLQPKPGVSRV